MGIGVSIFLIAVGAILRFAVHTSVSGISIHTVGLILMAAGALGLLVSLVIFAPRRRLRTVSSEERVMHDSPTSDRVIRERDEF